MSDEVWKRDEIESPCVRICLIHPEARICTGCYRTIEEITRWSRMTPEQRADILAELPTRAPLVMRRRGGRAGRAARRAKD